MMQGFDAWDVEVAPEIRLHGRSGGEGPPVVLLHGHPRAHTTWHRVAPDLAARGLAVVCPDLRGYGRSSTPAPDEGHERYSNRTMAQDVVALMAHLGHERFAVVGHDRGQGVAYRTALDQPDAVTALAVLDGLPHLEQAERVDARFATQWWHWFFFAGSPHAERVITADPDAWYGLDAARRTAMGEENFDYVRAALHDPLTVRAMLEDYRAGLSIDLEHDRHDRAEDHLPDARRVVGRRRHGGPLRRPRAALGQLGVGPDHPREDRQRPPHGRGEPGAAQPGAHRLPPAGPPDRSARLSPRGR